MRLAIFVLYLTVSWTFEEPQMEVLAIDKRAIQPVKIISDPDLVILKKQHNILTRIHHQRDKLEDTLHNWFRNGKNLIVMGRLGKVLLNSRDPNQNKGQFSFIDFKTLKFDPRKDWGFQIGNWYYIHKNSKVATIKPVEWNDDNRSKESEVGFEDFSGQNGGEREVGQVSSSSPLEPDGVSIQLKSSNIAKSKTNNIPDVFSAEVLNPNDESK